MTEPTRQTLHVLIDESLRLPDEYGSGLSSHLPMALHALAALGAGELALRAFASHYSARFDAAYAMPSPEPLADWPSHLGQFAALPLLQAHFAHELQHESVDAVLARSIPLLWRGLGTAAFHGLIRTAHAVESGHRAELARALGYWAARWWSLPDQTSSAQLAPRPWLDQLLAEPAPPAGHRISGRMRHAPLLLAYEKSRLALPAHGAGLRAAIHALAPLLADLYAQTDNFTVLHTVTGSRAALVLLPWAGEGAEAALSANLTAAVMAAHAKPDAPASEPGSIRAHADQLIRGLEAGHAVDDHAIKLVHACWALSDEGRSTERPAFVHTTECAFAQASQRAVRAEANRWAASASAGLGRPTHLTALRSP